MAKLSPADLFAQDTTDRGAAVIEALAPAATGVNKDGSVYSPNPGDQVASGNLTAVAQTVVLAVPQGMTTVSWLLSGTFVGTVAFEISVDGGTTFPLSLAATRADSASGGIAVSGNAVGIWEAAIPAGVTHVRGRCSAFTSGTIALRVAASWSPYEPAISIANAITAGLVAGTVVVGGVTKATITADETANVTATLAAAATGFGASRALEPSGLGTQNAGNGAYGDRLRAHVTGDQPFTLGVEFDSVTGFANPNEAGNVAAVAGRGGRYFASLDVAVLNRFGRIYVTNTGAAAMTTLRAFSTQVG